MDRKGQAAMEFLMTYGWAILAAIIAIGVLAYYGIFTPGKFVSNAVVIQAPFGAQGTLNGSGVTLELHNGAGQLITIGQVDITGCGSSLSSLTPSNNTRDVVAGNRTNYHINCTSALISGSTFRGDIRVTWKPQDSSLNQTTTGSITYRVP